MQDSTTEMISQLTPDQNTGLHVAWELIASGVPVFVAKADPSHRTGFALPPGWQRTVPDTNVLSQWRPGDALCAVMGHVLDLIDVDPRSGGAESIAQLSAAGLVPQVYAEATTPSGGRHLFVAAMGEASLDYGNRDGRTQGVAPGIDIKGGAADGTGRGFAFIAPTVRTSKETGQPASYHWTIEPEAGDIETSGDDSGLALAEMMRADRNRRARQAAPAVPVADPSDPFATTTPVRSFTREQASDFYLPHFETFRNMRTPEDHGFNAALNELAVVIGHFVPEFISLEKAESVIYEAAVHNRSVEFQGENSVRSTMHSGLKKGMSEPYFLERSPVIESVNDETPSIDAADLMMGQLLTPDMLDQLPNPRPLVQGILDLDSIAWMIGKSGSYKSFVALDLAACVGTGRDWHGHKTSQTNVIYVVAEGAKGIKLRSRAWRQVHGPYDGVWFYPLPVQSKDPKAWAALVELCRRLEAGFVIIDTQARVTVGLNENDNSEMGIYVDAADKIRQATGGCVLTVHHIGRNGLDARGASAIDGAQDTELRVDKVEDGQVVISLDKQKDGADTEKIELDLLLVDGGTDPETGRDLSSLVVVDKGLAIRPAKVAKWVEHRDGARGELLAVAREVYGDIGGTKAEIRASLAERRKDAGQPAMSRQTFGWAWSQLVKDHKLIKVEGAGQRWVGVGQSDLDAKSHIPGPRESTE